MSLKRKRTVLTIKQKLEIVEKLEKGESANRIASDYSVGVQTVRDIKNNKAKIQEFVAASDSGEGPSKRKTMKSAKHPALDEALLKWFNQKRLEGTPISGPICTQQAQKFHESLGLKDPFNASSGWFTRFKQRHGIRELTIQGEQLSGNISAAHEFCPSFQRYVTDHNLSYDQIYNADETGLYWKCLPSRTLASEAEKRAPGHKSSKERVTVMPCANASGTHKLKLLVIGKAKKPRSFKGTEVTLPVNYCNQKGAWMDREIFHKWFHNDFVPQVRSFLAGRGIEQKAVLLLDNAPSHPDKSTLISDDGLITVMYLPPNVTALIQPMDQGVISTMKRSYRTTLLKSLIEEENLISLWKKYRLVDAVYNIADAWKHIKPVTLMRSWKKILPNTDVECDSEDEDNIPLMTLARKIRGFESVDDGNLQEWLNTDADDAGFQHLTDEEIIQQTLEHKTDDEDSISESDEEMNVSKIKHQSALDNTNSLLDYMIQVGFDYTDVVSVRKIRNSIRQKISEYEKQTKITDFFKRGSSSNASN